MISAKVRLLNNHSQRQASKAAGVAEPYVAQAAVVLEFAPDLTDAVIVGGHGCE